jgi:hypothetical protein
LKDAVFVVPFAGPLAMLNLPPKRKFARPQLT